MLMCYYRLLVDLFSPTFSFEPIWEKLDVVGSRPFLPEFLQHMDKFIQLDNVMCLDDLTTEFFRRRAEIPNLVIDPAMHICYESSGNKTHPDHLVTYDPVALDAHLEKVFKWWNGEEAAKGVGPENARRCRYVYPCFLALLVYSCTRMHRSCKHAEYCHWRRSDGNTKPPTPVEW